MDHETSFFDLEREVGEVKPGAEGGTGMTAAGLTVTVGEAGWEGAAGVGYTAAEAVATEDWSFHSLIRRREAMDMSPFQFPFPITNYRGLLV